MREVQIIGDLSPAIVAKVREVRVDESDFGLRVHDGVTPGGHKIPTQEFNDSRYAQQTDEAANIGPFGASDNGILVRLTAGGYVLRAITVTSDLTLQNGKGETGNVQIGLANTIAGNKVFQGSIQSNSTITAAAGFLGNLTGNVTGNLTGNSAGLHTGAVSGNVTGNTAGIHTGNVVGNVTGALTGNSSGTHTGPVVGNVTGDVTGNLTGNVTGNASGNAGTATKLATPRSISMTGDVSWTINYDGSGNSTAVGEIQANVVGNTELSDMPAATLKGNNTAGATDPIDLNVTLVTAMLNSYVGDAGGTPLKGLVPAPTAADWSANHKFLAALGSFEKINTSWLDSTDRNDGSEGHMVIGPYVLVWGTSGTLSPDANYSMGFTKGMSKLLAVSCTASGADNGDCWGFLVGSVPIGGACSSLTGERGFGSGSSTTGPIHIIAFGLT